MLHLCYSLSLLCYFCRMETNRKVQRLTLSDMRNMMGRSGILTSEMFCLSGDFGISAGDNSAFRAIVPMGVPILVDDSRLGMLARGWIDATVNLIDVHIEAGAVAYLGHGSIVQINRMSPDLSVKGVLLRDDMLNHALRGQLPPAFIGKSYDLCPATSEADRGVIESILQAMWRIVSYEPFNREALCGMVNAMFSFYDTLFSRREAENGVAMAGRRDRIIFEKFIALVNANCREHRQLAYYADRLCLTERYLGVVVSQTSGTTAKEWVDRAVITAAKVLLRHTDKSIGQIADELHFANDSFFCKYFRRIEGVAPGEYRKRS